MAKVKSTRKSLTGILQSQNSHQTLPEQFDRKLQEAKRLEELRKAAAKTAVFGVPLTSSCPTLVCDCMAYIRERGMRTEGLFRIPGDTDTVNVLKERYEKGEKSNVLATMRLDIHDVGTLFKLFFRVLPEPLLPTSHYDRLMDSVRHEGGTREEVVAGVLAVVRDIPSPQRECLGMIIHFLREVTLLEQYNKMTPANLATCFAPTLLRAPDSTDAQQAFMDMSAAIGALNILIRDHEPLPTPLAAEIARNTMYNPPPASSASLLPGNSATKPPPGMAARSPSVYVGSPPGMDKPPGFE
ncbi:hypothetical protein BASA81_001196 [Batrachochytrium salamandrivorans]|nr:hypothetical protein BASA81_001196 [Batrachochytrium salamandrivorans]